REHVVFFFSSRRRHTRLQGDWSSDVCSSDLRTTILRCAASSCCERIKYGTFRAFSITGGWPRVASPRSLTQNRTRRKQPGGPSRSEERRVGKECRSGRTTRRGKKKKMTNDVV